MSKPKTILFVEDNEKFRRLSTMTLEKTGYQVVEAASGEEAAHKINKREIDIILLDILLPDTTGLKLLESWKPQYEDIPIIVCTAYGDIGDAVKAMKMGAFDYLTKPMKAEELKVVIERAIEWQDLHYENRELKAAVENKFQLQGMVTRSRSMIDVFDLIERVAPQDVTVLMEGESGTGKSRCARAIHQESRRKDGPFVKVNCAAIPSNLLESELFGYEKGAFTGADTSKKGLCLTADKGTLFLDEIGEISIDLQAKLLQFTQDKTFTPLGSGKEVSSDVRLIAATNRNLWDMVQAGEFREDLYYRLNIIGLKLPPLKERTEDIPGLIQQFLSEYEKDYQRSYSISDSLVQKLCKYPWPGNIRELQNAIARAVVLTTDGELKLDDFPYEVIEYFEGDTHGDEEGINLSIDEDFSLPDHIEQVEVHAIEEALRAEHGNQARAAERLDISRQSLLYKIRKYNIDLDRD
ncbi:sigma-54 dependent transcriptional regulator [Salinibacillus aidingensis]|uniref:Sigma-54 dependent transcriptional regulator n=1 Tax=Salinibacillus aidingensis TaxID=237684 RepID=A0ABN1B1E0_9BACI